MCHPLESVVFQSGEVALDPVRPVSTSSIQSAARSSYCVRHVHSLSAFSAGT